MNRMEYSSICDNLVTRIEALVPAHPEILTMRDVWDLFKVPGFRCDDLGPSMAQAMAALQEVQHRAQRTKR